MMEETNSLVIFAMVISFGALLFYKTYEPIRRWAWSDVEEKKKTHDSGSSNKKHLS
ncbi:hypothetical protein [Bacillus cereus]|uniref:hypothetical protein n=1 Tax=Bacillus cereus TaxID=1396 RepID=UPI001591F318|nr:hypothetical protein [Bacillus cereus]